MISWKIAENNFDAQRATSLGNKYLIGNGYMGIRGTPEEFSKEGYPAVNLAGIYDQVGDGWREPLNAPNGLFTRLMVEDETCALPTKECVSHIMELDYRYGIVSRETVFETKKGKITVQTKRFVSMVKKHLIVLQVTVIPEFDGEIDVVTGIDGDVWDINGPHYDCVETQVIEKLLHIHSITHENKDRVSVFEAVDIGFEMEERIEYDKKKIVRHLKIPVRARAKYRFHKYISVYTSKEEGEYQDRGKQLVVNALRTGFEELLLQHKKSWEEKWDNSEVLIEGDKEGMEALNYSIYHLHSIAPRHHESLSIAARGLSGQTYKGAVFWDTEMFMLDFFLFTEPQVAKTLLNYRIDTLEGARKKAKGYGLDGAFYAWESQEGGYDACSDYNVTDVFTGRPMRTYFKDKQIHISAAVVYGMMRYIVFSGKRDLLNEGGAEVIIECAKFYYSLLIKQVKNDRYELWDVIGPDEYHERVNNNAYTNKMAKFTFETALNLLKAKDLTWEVTKYTAVEREKLLLQFTDAVNHLFIPLPDENTGIIEQFDGYHQLEEVSINQLKKRLLHEKEYWGGAYGVATHTKVIKQADVVTMMNLFSKEYSEEILLKNWEYYEPKTEHGSSLSACMYSMLACKCHMQDRAYPFFIKSANADLIDTGKQWAGLIYIGGTHPAASGGAYMTAIEGFAGIHVDNGVLKATPRLPKGWKKMSFKLYYQGERYQITVTRDEAKVERIGDQSLNIEVGI